MGRFRLLRERACRAIGWDRGEIGDRDARSLLQRYTGSSLHRNRRPALFMRRWRRLLVIVALLVVTTLALDAWFPVPLPTLTGDLSTMVVDAEDRPLRAFPSPSGVWRFSVTEDQVAADYFRALFAFEDRWFYRHPGVNPAAMVRAMGQALLSARVVSGGSTLTMQVARIIEPQPRNLLGKARQIVRALQLEAHLSKAEILALYLNYAPFGGTVQGVEAASYAYLGKPARSLSLAEAALLVSLPQAPSRLRPDRHPEAARKARDKVLRRMADLGVVSAAAASTAMNEPVDARRLAVPMWAPHLAERLHQQQPGAAVIRTNIDLGLQMTLEARLAEYFGRLDRRVSGAVVVMDHRDGAVLAYVGGVSFGDPLRAGHIDLVKAQRSPGSTLKPFIYGLALDEGLIHSESLLLDVPLSFQDYNPQNFDRQFLGPVAAADALKRSLNLPAVQLLDRVSPNRFVARLEHVGLRLALPAGGKPNLSLALGGGATTLEALVGAHSALAHQGISLRPRLLRDDPGEARRLLSAGAAYIVRDMLRERAHPFLSWKTGTSFGFRDAWAIGSTPDFSAGVWVGRPDGTPLPGSMGADTALPLLRQILLALPRRSTREQPPSSVAPVEICWPLGRALADTAEGMCVRRWRALALDGRVPPTLGAPAQASDWMPVLDVRVDAQTGERLSLGCAAGQGIQRRIARWPRELSAWLSPAYAQAQALPPRRADCPPDGLDDLDPLRIEGLPENAHLRALPGSSRGPSASLYASGASGQVHWLVNGELAARLASNQHFVHFFEQRGENVITALGDGGRYARLRIMVD
jgi:penicillin-binding protein 1C